MNLFSRLVFRLRARFLQAREHHILKEKVACLQNEISYQKKQSEDRIALLEDELSKKNAKILEKNFELSTKLEELRKKSFYLEDVKKEYERLEEECVKIKESEREKLKRKDLLIREYQKTISEQRIVIEKKQKICAELSERVQRLSEELKSLLQLEEKAKERSFVQTPLSSSLPSYPIPSHDLSFVLKNCIEKAESLTGAMHLGGATPRFLDLSFDSFAVDKRGLSDSFYEEEGQGIIFIFSHTEKKFLYVNKHVKTVLGHGIEKFTKEFSNLVTSGLSEWKGAMLKALRTKEAHTSLVMQNKFGKNVSLECLMSPILKGPFAHHILGVMVPD